MEAFADAVFEGCPIMLNRVEVWGVRGEIAQGATGVGERCCQGGSVMHSRHHRVGFHHATGIAGLGRLSYEAQHGLYVHPTLAVTPAGVVLGVLDAWMLSGDSLN